LFDVKINVSVIVLESDRMSNLKFCLALFGENDNQDVEILYEKWNLLPDNLSTEIFLYFCRVIELIYVVTKMSFEWIADTAIF
jgi:hypothetical protein